MTPDELRALADEAAPHGHGSGPLVPVDIYSTFTQSQKQLCRLAPDLARLCADLAEAIDAADSRKHAFEYGGRATAWRALRKTRAKLSELKPAT